MLLFNSKTESFQTAPMTPLNVMSIQAETFLNRYLNLEAVTVKNSASNLNITKLNLFKTFMSIRVFFFSF